jgi:hypothetical protein
MGSRYELYPDSDGWTILDRLSGRTANVDGFILRGLDFDDADVMLERLNNAVPGRVARRS